MAILQSQKSRFRQKISKIKIIKLISGSDKNQRSKKGPPIQSETPFKQPLNQKLFFINNHDNNDRDDGTDVHIQHNTLKLQIQKQLL